MNEQQKTIIRCAFADLCGAMQAHLNLDTNSHDWKAHLETISEMVQAFDFLEPIPADLVD